jgi:hypothetical protein
VTRLFDTPEVDEPQEAWGRTTTLVQSPDLAEALAHGPFSRALTLAIECSGLSLHRLQYRLGQRGVHISTTTLSYWKNGRSRPERPDSLHGLRVLEDLLGLPDRVLVGLLGPRRPRGRWVSPVAGSVRLEHLYEQPDALVEMMHGLNMPNVQPLQKVSVDESLRVGADRVQQHLRVREVVRANQDRVAHSYVLLRNISPGCPPQVVDTRYCRLGRVRVCPDSAMMLAELVLDRVLFHGDSTILEYELDVRDNEPDPRYDRRFQQAAHEYVLQVGFHPDAVPARCSSYRRDTASAPDQEIEPVWISQHQMAHLVRLDVTPGIYGLTWSW